MIYEDSYWDIHFNLATDLTDLSLEANASAIYSDDCSPEPLLGNCMLLDTVGTTHIMPVSGAPLSGIYQPDVVLGTSYGVMPDRRQRLGYVRDYDRPFAGTLGIHGRFGIAAHVDYYQVQYAKWTAADILAWDLNHAHVPPAAAFSQVPVSALGSIPRAYLEESPLPVHWIGETFAPHTVSGIPALYKSRERFEQEYRDSHGGADPAPDFGGWFWSYGAETLLFVIDSSKVSNGLYSFRFVGYRQTGVDGSGNPILTLVTMGLPGGIGRRCGTTSPELVTLYLHDTVHQADCDILNFRKNGVDVIDECAMVTLTPADWIEVEYRAFDAAGHLDSYGVSLQKGASAASSIFGLAGVSDVPGACEGRNRVAALADPTTPAIPPYWYGGTEEVAHSTFVAPAAPVPPAPQLGIGTPTVRPRVDGAKPDEKNRALLQIVANRGTVEAPSPVPARGVSGGSRMMFYWMLLGPCGLARDALMPRTVLRRACACARARRSFGSARPFLRLAVDLGLFAVVIGSGAIEILLLWLALSVERSCSNAWRWGRSCGHPNRARQRQLLRTKSRLAAHSAASRHNPPAPAQIPLVYPLG